MSTHAETITIQVNIVSLGSEIYSGEALCISAPALSGVSIGAWCGRMPTSPSRAGEVRILTPQNSEELVYVSGGMLEVQPALVTILADMAARAKHSDRAAAAEAKRLTAESMQRQDRFTREVRAYAELLSSIAEMMTEGLRKSRRR
ncbi:F0F1 ATP synthase subunit epsilon [Sulfuricella sp.]|uniref:F0F1 ATP synthase subunit epsilon n=1 Tax=Sulfuricella sp. TaxID=2099377 RepID=UPI002CBAF1A9|nr:F0F1 ATP synthase subunit epsilon [Sulfuricella sp.]HUX63083.1 F0F1 ATP synthase subunit epsilon [Sulfuricella sp.]